MKNQLHIHLLTSLGLARINRGSTGDLKKMVLGGVTRQYISSQCQKQFWRSVAQEIAALEKRNDFGIIRTSAGSLRKTLATQYPFVTEASYKEQLDLLLGALFGEKVAEPKKEKPPKKGKGGKGKTAEVTPEVDADEATSEAPETSEDATQQDPEKEKAAGKQLLVFSDAEYKALFAVVANLPQAPIADGKAATKVVKTILGHKWNFMLAGLGRLVTSNTEFNVDKGLSVAHALGTSGIRSVDD